jgi:hypothetical protein
MNSAEKIHEFMKEISKQLPTVEQACENIRKNMEAIRRYDFSEPELIQGYTAEQWQEIIDGGYLCEFTSDDYRHAKISKLKECDGVFCDVSSTYWHSCRPAQIKGVMRPIWVEPESTSSDCVFFDGDNRIVREGKWYEAEIPRSVSTKYIEL